MPDFEGAPEHDTVLEYAVSQHPDHVGNLYRVPIGYWLTDAIRSKVIDQIKGGSKGLRELDPTFYEVRNTFKEDAGKCYQQHNRPTGACAEFRSDKKALRPDTNAERKDAGLPLLTRNSPGPKTYLCDFCVVRRFYERKSNEEKGIG